MQLTEIKGTMSHVMSHLEVAERELARARRKYGAEVPHAFAILYPTPVLRGTAPRVYRSHCRELIRRVVRNQDTRAPTRAELMCAVSRMSLAAPLNEVGAAAYEYLFRRVMGRAALERVLGDRGPAREPWPGAIGELLHGLRRRMRVETRITT